MTERPREEASYAGHPAYDADSGDAETVEAAEVPVTGESRARRALRRRPGRMGMMSTP